MRMHVASQPSASISHFSRNSSRLMWRTSKRRVRQGPFLPPLVWTKNEPIEAPVVMEGDFLQRRIANREQLQSRHRQPAMGEPGQQSDRASLCCSFSRFSQQRRRWLFAATFCYLGQSLRHPRRRLVPQSDRRKGRSDSPTSVACSLKRHTHASSSGYKKSAPTPEHRVAYRLPKLSRFDRRQGVIVVEPDDQKLVPQRDILEAALKNTLQTIWSRKFWGTPRDEAFLRRLDFFPRLLEVIKEKKWGVGVGFQPFYPGASPGKPKPLRPWKLSDEYLPNSDNFPQMVLQQGDFTTLKKGLEASIHQQRRIPALLDGLRRKPAELCLQSTARNLQQRFHEVCLLSPQSALSRFPSFHHWLGARR